MFIIDYPVHTTTCYTCHVTVVLDTETMTVKSVGELDTLLFENSDGVLMWDCPACECPDAYDDRLI